MSSPSLYLLSVGPLSLYLWVLALWQSGRNPKVVRGLTDFALLAFALGGVLTFGPVGRFVARAVFHSTELVDLLTVGSAFGLLAWGFAVRSGPNHGQCLAADAVDAPGPPGLAERARLGVRVFGQPADHVGGAERLQPVGGVRPCPSTPPPRSPRRPADRR